MHPAAATTTTPGTPRTQGATITVPYNDEPPFDPEHDGGVVTPIRNAPPSNPEAEQHLLGALLAEPTLAAKLADHVDPDDFYQPRHETIWHAIHETARANGVPPDVTLVAAHLMETGALLAVGGGPYLHTLIASCPNPGTAEHYAALVRNAARARALATVGTRLTQLAHTATPDTLDRALSDGLQDLDDATARVGPRHTALIRVPNIDELLAKETSEYDWVVPGLIEHQERVILTAEEGAGKSTLLRQIAMCAATGIHPFTGEHITPQRVLHVDVENSESQSIRQYKPLRIQAGKHMDPDQLRVQVRIEGLDLTTPTDVTWLNHVVQAVSPDLIVIGPIYKLANGDPTEEKSSKPVAMALDQIRATSRAAIILEAHAAKAPSGSKKRPHEPYGWSGWMRWPEIGIFLEKDGTISHWRGAREERTWPTELKRGGTWPWTAVPSDADRRWEQIRTARLAHRAPMSFRDVSRATNLSTTTVAGVIGNGSPYGSIWTGWNTNHHPEDDPR